MTWDEIPSSTVLRPRLSGFVGAQTLISIFSLGFAYKREITSEQPLIFI